jgi:hypothetical protein
VHGDEEYAVGASLVVLLQGVDVLKRPTDSLGRKSTDLVVVELMLAPCETKIVVDAGNRRIGDMQHRQHVNTTYRHNPYVRRT